MSRRVNVTDMIFSLSLRQPPVDHDSLRAFMQVVRPQGADIDARPPTPEESLRVKAILAPSGDHANER